MSRSLMLAVALITLVSSVALAQQYIITPIDTNRDLERRVQMLERAVHELQIKVYNLQNTQIVITPTATPNPRKFFCSVKAFNQTFKGYGPTETETREKVLDQCAKQSNEMHCRDVSCKLNE